MISVLMPIKNGIEFIEESVTSVIQQTHPDWTLLVGVNGHVPNSEVFKRAKEFESRDSRIKVFDLPESIQGKSSALNELVKHTDVSSVWISLLDVDDIWLPTKLQTQLPFMNSFDVIGTQCSYFGDITGSPQLPVGDITRFNFLTVNPIINSSCLVRKDVCYWKSDSDLFGIEDYEMWLRLWVRGTTFYNVPFALVKHRVHRNSAFNSKRGNGPALAKLCANYSRLKTM